MIKRLEAVSGRIVSRETFGKLATYVQLLTEASSKQNLIARATVADIWERHIIDSAQLLRFAPPEATSWLDIGPGAGLPGIVIACISKMRVTLAEPRNLRSQFLSEVVHTLRLNVEVRPCKAERLSGTFDVISARAVAAMSDLLRLSCHLSTGNTHWILPKGRNALSELEDAERSWQGAFHVERSATDDDSWIVVATGVRAKSS